jgi:hypothetical protein
MAWRRRTAGRKRKVDAKRYPSGGVVHERVEPPEAVMARRRALFGNANVQAQTDWLIDRMWGAGDLSDKEREAAQRLNALHRGRVARRGAPRGAAMTFRDAGGSVRSGWAMDEDDAATLDREYLAALVVLRRLGGGARNVALAACCYQAPAPTPVLRVALDALAQHFARPQKRRLELAPAPEARSGEVRP